MLQERQSLVWTIDQDGFTEEQLLAATVSLVAGGADIDGTLQHTSTPVMAMTCSFLLPMLLRSTTAIHCSQYRSLSHWRSKLFLAFCLSVVKRWCALRSCKQVQQMMLSVTTSDLPSLLLGAV